MLLSQEVSEGVEVLAVDGPGRRAGTPPSCGDALDAAVATGPRGVVVDLSDAGALARRPPSTS